MKESFLFFSLDFKEKKILTVLFSRIQEVFSSRISILFEQIYTIVLFVWFDNFSLHIRFISFNKDNYTRVII